MLVFMSRLFVVICGAVAGDRWPRCVDGFDLSGGELSGHLPAPNGAVDCEMLCASNASCVGYSYHLPAPCSDHGETCPHYGGCCDLKHEGDMNPTTEHKGMFPNNNRCSCSALMRVPDDNLPPPPTRGRNVLYVLFDDLRPELPGAYGHDFVRAPNILKLMESGTVFRKAYCQIAVCSPSRMSFLTGRRPTTTRSMNFMDHFRQADCGIHFPNTAYEGAGEVVAWEQIGLGHGGSGQCCTTCTLTSRCARWTYVDMNCTMYAVVSDVQLVGKPRAISGVSGALRDWTSLPEAFKKGGWLTMGTGKIFHPEEGGTGPPSFLRGGGMPPNQDPLSWTPGLSMSQVNSAAPMDDKAHTCHVYPNMSTCPVVANQQGTPMYTKTHMNDGEFEDKIIANDAILKMRLAATFARPFMLAVGFRKPHLTFRFPAPFLNYYPTLADVPIAKHPTMDASIPPIAHQDTANPGGSPWQPIDENNARRFRLYYAATITWVDSQFGRVLDELESLGLVNNTVIVMHSDHGWSLGEQGEWQKFTNFELGARVPLVIRDPLRPAGVSDAVVELVDVMPTLMDLAGVPSDVVRGETLEGSSLTPLLDGGESGRVALSLYPRCPNKNVPSDDPQEWWKQNECLLIDRTEYSFMGLSLRSNRWRYTEWLRWDGWTETPHWNEGPVAVELYDHFGDDGSDFDAFENENLAQSPVFAPVASQLATLLRSAYRVSLHPTAPF